MEQIEDIKVSVWCIHCGSKEIMEVTKDDPVYKSKNKFKDRLGKEYYIHTCIKCRTFSIG